MLGEFFGWFISYKASVVLDARPDKLFMFLSDLQVHDMWVGGDMLGVSKGPVGVGSSFNVERRNQEGHPYTCTFTVTEFVPDRRLVYETKLDSGEHEVYFFDLEPQPTGKCRVTHGKEARVTGFLVWLLVLIFPITVVILAVAKATYVPYKVLSTRFRLKSMVAAADSWEEPKVDKIRISQLSAMQRARRERQRRSAKPDQ